MAGKRGSGVYLGTTRRQRNASMRKLLTVLSALMAAAVLAALGLAWLLRNTESFPPPVQDAAERAGSTSGADADTVLSAGTEQPSVPAAEQTRKVLDYTESWVVMLDPGHGFDDIGTSSPLLGDTNEAVLNLDLALRMKSVLEGEGITVSMTHDTNAVPGRVSTADGGEPPLRDLVLLPPEDRAVLANGQDIDLYVSVHCDSLPDRPEVRGMRVYYHKNPDFPAVRNSGAEALASCLADRWGLRMEEPLPAVKAMAAEDAYYVIRFVEVPSVLCEVGFVTNADDAAALTDPAWRQTAAQALSEGILSYIRGAE